MAVATSSGDGEPNEPHRDILRSYQQEMLESSLERNTIVVLIWLLANSVELSNQHFQTLSLHLSAYRIISLTGADGVDNWSDQRRWDAVLLNVRVVIGTPAVLKDALTHSFVHMSKLCLVVFDEAHHCIKNDPMNAIMKNFYHPAKSRAEHVPHILGLTASPAINPKAGSLQQLEANLDATVITPRRSLDELMKFVYPPHIAMIQYAASDELGYPGADGVCSALENAALHYDFSRDPYVLQLRRYDDDKARRDMQKVLEKQKTHCSEELRVLNRRAATMYAQLGVTAAREFILTCIERFEASTVQIMVMPDTSMHEQQHLLTILQKIRSNAATLCAGAVACLSSKAERLVSLLYEQAAQVAGAGRAIIFVRERATVVGLADILCRSSKLKCLYQVGAFVGTSSFDGRSSIADLAELRKQAEDLRHFREGNKNLIIATSVLEEGIDVRECNLVINFDAPDTLIGFLQRRGRARKEGSKYYVLVEEGNDKIDPSKWRSQEEQMKQEYSDEQRERQLAESLDEKAINTRVYRIPSTSALLTLHDAKAHLHHFCSVSTFQASNYIDTRPDYHATSTVDPSGEKSWTARVTLPSFVDPSLRSASSRGPWRSETAAIKDAAFEAYIALHKAGLLNDRLLPLVKAPVADAGGHVDQPSIIEVAARLDSWVVLAKAVEAQRTQWHAAEVSITSCDGQSFVITMLLPVPLTAVQCFMLYWNEATSYTATIAATKLLNVEPEQRAELRQHTHAMLQMLHSSRMAQDKNDFPFLLYMPTHIQVVCVPALKRFICWNEDNIDPALVYVADRPGKPYILQRLATGSFGELDLVVTAFAKRKDFLHPVAERLCINTAYTSEEVFPAKDCTVHTTPFEYCLFAAFIPSFLHRIDTRLLAEDLRSGLLRDLHIGDVDLVSEAITAPSAGEARDYNRLEFLGDSILKFCASLQVTSQHLTWPERFLTLEKFRLVRNCTLCQGALKLGLDRYILTKSFTGAKWRPPYVSSLLAIDLPEKRSKSSKTVADVAEALIGAAFVDGGIEKAYQSIQIILSDEVWHDLGNSIDTLTPASVEPGHDHALAQLEDMIGHRFTNKTLLLEAITHASLPFQRTGMSYERLEFLGDAVLDLIIVPKLYAHERKLKHYEMHNLHEALVNGVFLGYCCMQYSAVQQYNQIVKTQSGKYDVQESARLLHLHDFVRASGHLLHAKQASLEVFDRLRVPIADAFAEGKEYPWPDLVAMAPMKFFSDLVESTLGAVFIDCHGNLQACETFLERLGVLPIMRQMLEGRMETISPKEKVGILAGNDSVVYSHSMQDTDGRRSFVCEVMVGEVMVARRENCGSKSEAEVRAAAEAVKILSSRKSSRNKREFVEGGAGEMEVEDGAVDIVPAMQY
ncbi:Dicer-like protein 2 [Recurvomyces mirabilis]|uniref:Dicer-like protein 2 n=1 Tax=Recurvomyces mirabilis TaxID=574656 RepID=A0AAE1C1T2_9PEZI|nr:Dicer-like protein 2 [Recurvomyces mirabilis]KAK5158408.1 Dicer-like protein 2 [Recurvomyces mirabilis]